MGFNSGFKGLMYRHYVMQRTVISDASRNMGLVRI